MKEKSFEKLLEPAQLGRIKTKNRMVRSAAGYGWGDGYTGQFAGAENAFFEALAKGGVGLIIIGSNAIEFPRGSYTALEPHIADDSKIKRFREMTDIIHKYNCPTLCDLAHFGAWHQGQFDGIQPVSSSDMKEDELPPGSDIQPQVCKGLNLGEVEEIIDKFAQAAERAEKAGFDGVEINGATYHLINSFMSRVWNKRQDKYGNQNLENRSRFLVEIIKAIKKKLGEDFHVGVLYNCVEFGIERGTTIEEGLELAKIIEKAGADHLHARATGYGDLYRLHFPEQMFFPEAPKIWPKQLDPSRHGAGLWVPICARIKKTISLPLVTVGRYNPVLGEQVLKEGNADFIAFNRTLITDPELPNKVASGNMNDIVPCSACLECLNYAGRLKRGGGATCRINVAFGRDSSYYSIKPASKKKNVLVVGGGPAGLEAARVAALKGHKVTLCEKESKVGGAALVAAIIKGPDVEDILGIVRYLENQIHKLGVKVMLSKEVDAAFVEEMKPDVVILANGGKPFMPDIPGIDGEKVIGSGELQTKIKKYLKHLEPMVLGKMTRYWMPLGKKVVIVGGDIHGCLLAAFLVRRGRTVTIVDTEEDLGDGLSDLHRFRLFRWFVKKQVTLLSGVKYECITDEGITVITKEGGEEKIAADTIIPVLPFQPNTEFFDQLKGKVSEVYAIGDCKEPKLIIDAIADGSLIARKV